LISSQIRALTICVSATGWRIWHGEVRGAFVGHLEESDKKGSVRRRQTGGFDKRAAEIVRAHIVILRPEGYKKVVPILGDAADVQIYSARNERCFKRRLQLRAVAVPGFAGHAVVLEKNSRPVGQWMVKYSSICGAVSLPMFQIR
jgi:hypothetical protein